MSADRDASTLRIAHLTSAHNAFDTRIFVKECRTAAETGDRVALIAPHDRAECVQGIEVRPIPCSTSRLSRIVRTPWHVFREARGADAELYQFHDPELIPVGILLKCLGNRVIYDVHEDLSKQVFSMHWIPKPIRSLASLAARAGEWIGTTAFDGIVAATPDIAERFPARKTVVVQNFPIEDELCSGPSSGISYADRPLHALYVGGISRARGIFELVTAIGEVPQAIQAKLSLAGTFRPSQLHDELLRMPGWDRVEFQGHCSREGVRHLMQNARLGIVTLLPFPNYLRAYPVKLFEYMSAGLPVVASDFPLWRRIVETAGCGLLVNPERPAEIAGAIAWLLEHPEEAEAMGRRGQLAIREKYNWRLEAAKLLEFYERFRLHPKEDGDAVQEVVAGTSLSPHSAP